MDKNKTIIINNSCLGELKNHYNKYMTVFYTLNGGKINVEILTNNIIYDLCCYDFLTNFSNDIPVLFSIIIIFV